MKLTHAPQPEHKKPAPISILSLLPGTAFVYSYSPDKITQLHEGVFLKTGGVGFASVFTLNGAAKSNGFEFGVGPVYFFLVTLSGEVAAEPIRP